ncbi:PD40 domain-containing protein [Conexibacter woesei]|uniref:Periplasmic component of the Tol biopolymer transport system-like protein n=1 Tax=Conexibacter woesei (strain DSM 14684 / CCUG 47730 / CIP 108061 / JCM 11494 / NBRC 100937 / ID131577) TaxID=469383 RepID=D3F907_CONWI|nr:PD40 domain-containing protein [Conexibacter woesei]ADB53002.1 Periplasmic component of the Tol biopolymer transport system-like protein [Conexibacter woesei DSM 14684]
MRRLALPLVSLALTALLAAPVAHAFPGRNGAIAYGWFSLTEDELGEQPSRTLHALRLVTPAGGEPRELRSCLLVGGEPARPCEAPQFDTPAWSPDGTRIAFDAGTRIGLLDGDGGGTVRLLPARGLNSGRPVFSPSGTQLAFDAGPSAGGQQLWISDLFGGGARRLTGRGGRSPAWSTRGTIAFERDGQLYAIRPDGSGLRRLTGRGGRAPAWSPHGTKLAFVRRRADLLYVMNADGSGLRQVRGPRGVESVRWSPDGRRLVYEAFDAGVLTIGTDGRGERQLVQDAVGGTYVQAARGVDWQPLR